MILANDFLEYLLNTERDLAARVRDRYDMYLKSLPVPQLADGKIVIDGRYMIDSHEGISLRVLNKAPALFLTEQRVLQA
ncbi:TPA: hypothetical protein KIU43_003724 [Escherichia coli]|nr:hypothetical protein [Escherichia coli]EGM8955545.1 hypothetical protein [Escherichia coli]HBD3218957.1 hypothetical protein [Escherichia coli]